MKPEQIRNGRYYTDGKVVRQVCKVGPSGMWSYPIICGSGELSYCVAGELPGRVVHGAFSDECGPISLAEFAEWAIREVEPLWVDAPKDKDVDDLMHPGLKL